MVNRDREQSGRCVIVIMSALGQKRRDGSDGERPLSASSGHKADRNQAKKKKPRRGDGASSGSFGGTMMGRENPSDALFLAPLPRSR